MILLITLSSLLANLANAEIQVLFPSTLKSNIGNEGKIKSSLANFGHIQYGT